MIIAVRPHDNGFAEGQNMAVLHCWAEGPYERPPGLVAALRADGVIA
jgi:hypothetical protein